MEEVDKIIIHSIRSLGCDISEEIVSLHSFTVEMVVAATARCLLTINEQLDISAVLPQSMSARFRVGSALATSCQGLGYQGEIGYQTFLYANEHELRKVLMFLIEKLPKEASDAIDEPLSRGTLLNNRVASELKRQLSVPWTPSYTKISNVMNIDSSNWFFQGCSTFNKINTNHLLYPSKGSTLKEVPAYVTSQHSITSNNVNPSIHEENILAVALENEWDVEWNQMGMSTGLTKKDYKKRKHERLMKKIKEKLLTVSQNASNMNNKNSTAVGLKELLDSFSGDTSKKSLKGSRFTHAEKLQFAQEYKHEQVELLNNAEQSDTTLQESKEDIQKRQQDEIHDLGNELNELSTKFQQIQLNIKQMTAQKEQVDEISMQLEESNKKEGSMFKVKRKTFELLPDAEENLRKLQQLIETSSTRQLNLNDQWEKHRVPLVEKYRQLKDEHSNRMSEVESKIELIRILREKMKLAADDTHSKEEILKQLAEEFDRMSKDTNRSAYTKRILEIVGNIKKQKDEISKVLVDTKSLQKDINFLNGKLDRTFTETDELIFKDVKKDEFNRKAYKMLANLHEGFGTLVEAVEETGVIMREIRDLEEQLDNLNEADILENLDKICKDIDQIKQENNELIAKYKKLKK